MAVNNQQKLELTWIGKENRPRLEPRILLEDPEKSYHAPRRVTDILYVAIRLYLPIIRKLRIWRPKMLLIT